VPCPVAGPELGRNGGAAAVKATPLRVGRGRALTVTAPPGPYSRVMRPKFISTVSIPADALVSSAWVRSGMISETAPTNVVLPALNPPEMTIFIEATPHPSECS